MSMMRCIDFGEVKTISSISLICSTVHSKVTQTKKKEKSSHYEWYKLHLIQLWDIRVHAWRDRVVDRTSEIEKAGDLCINACYNVPLQVLFIAINWFVCCVTLQTTFGFLFYFSCKLRCYCCCCCSCSFDISSRFVILFSAQHNVRVNWDQSEKKCMYAVIWMR